MRIGLKIIFLLVDLGLASMIRNEWCMIFIRLLIFQFPLCLQIINLLLKFKLCLSFNFLLNFLDIKLLLVCLVIMLNLMDQILNLILFFVILSLKPIISKVKALVIRW